MADVVRKASKAKRKAKSSKSTMKMKKSGKAGKEKKNGPSGKRRHKFSLEAKLGKLVSQKCYEETLRADALGAGLAVLDVTASSTTATKETRQPTALATLGACPLVSPVVLGDASREVPMRVDSWRSEVSVVSNVRAYTVHPGQPPPPGGGDKANAEVLV